MKKVIVVFIVMMSMMITSCSDIVYDATPYSSTVVVSSNYPVVIPSYPVYIERYPLYTRPPKQYNYLYHRNKFYKNRGYQPWPPCHYNNTYNHSTKPIGHHNNRRTTWRHN